ncbi:MAG: NUDIX domain-containing protein [Nocardioidaceae bacterium]
MDDRTRLAVRIVLLDTASRVLLFEGRDLSDDGDSVRFWFTAGGGVDESESLVDAADREVKEETGQSGLNFVGPIHRREFDFFPQNRGPRAAVGRARLEQPTYGQVPPKGVGPR